ncbi:bifunctional phosphoribosyl-AMP cyclohydrolase/phosphoribosyl-ATP diphosphatase HisIE [soil metagenome]
MTDFSKSPDGLIPAIIQDVATKNVLMLGFMNKEALEATKLKKQVTYFSRSKQRLWTKGETSGNFLNVTDIIEDCDNDTLLIKVKTEGPVCHTGTDTCFSEKNEEDFLIKLTKIIRNRKTEPDQNSYISQLLKKGINKIAQKVGEEAVELVIEAKDNNNELFKSEAADLLFHYLILLEAKNVTLTEITQVLKQRHKK